jgi:hypothetical protein
MIQDTKAGGRPVAISLMVFMIPFLLYNFLFITNDDK